MVNDALFSSDKNFWETPQNLFDELNAEFNFTLDAAASDENHKCTRYFTQKEDGLRQNWGGRNGILQPALWQQGNGPVDGEVLSGGAEAGDNGSAADTRTDRPRQLSRLHSGQGGDTLPAG